ncbi:NUDIX hydrolase [Neoroseomonas soli]|uniref:NUDIX hydrolase n=1 Tax=Neoroseomonas soli TaxID=1081025 RepID=A0A9X9X451_9PROT|nr:NUDIX hydrolase [Neoroseomonas soli]MBR0674180.1 NUDIX hydrolase [Neoroseomonas soli]
MARTIGAAWGRSLRRQCAALPIREREGELLVLLITTRGRGRWVIPKGWAEEGVPPHALAAREAFEEAGLLGRAAEAPIGAYSYRKRLPDGRRAICEVEVFALEVEARAVDWPERGQRRKRWVSLQQAAALVSEPGLAALLLGLRPAAA